MKLADIKKGLLCCLIDTSCSECPYENAISCEARLGTDVLNLIDWSSEDLQDVCDEDMPDTPQKAPETPQPWTREKILAEAKKNVCGQREQDYGTPEDSFLTVANLWTAYHGVEFTPIDVAAMLGLLKIARISSNPKHMDSWVDLAGYAACGGEIAGEGA